MGITVTTRIVVKKGPLNLDINPGIQNVALTGQRYSALVQDIGYATHELLTVGADVGTAGWAMVENIDATHYVRIGLQGHPLSTPAAPTVTPIGANDAGAEYTYRVSALDADGETLASPSSSLVPGNSVLSGANFNRITWAAVPGAVGYRVYGRLDGFNALIATLGAVTQYDDTGAVTPAGAVPSANTTTGFYPFAKPLPGESFPVPLATKNLYARAEGPLSTPSAPTVTPIGTAGAIAYSYKVVALDTNGQTLPSPAGTTATGNATLSSTNFNRLTWSAVPRAVGYRVFGRTSGAESLIATLGNVLTYDDNGSITPSGGVPGLNTTGIVKVEYSVLER